MAPFGTTHIRRVPWTASGLAAQSVWLELTYTSTYAMGIPMPKVELPKVEAKRLELKQQVRDIHGPRAARWR